MDVALPPVADPAGVNMLWPGLWNDSVAVPPIVGVIPAGVCCSELYVSPGLLVKNSLGSETVRWF